METSINPWSVAFWIFDRGFKFARTWRIRALQAEAEVGNLRELAEVVALSCRMKPEMQCIVAGLRTKI